MNKLLKDWRLLAALLIFSALISITTTRKAGAVAANATNVTNLGLDGNNIYDSNDVLRITIGGTNVFVGSATFSGTVGISSGVKMGNSLSAPVMPDNTIGGLFGVKVPFLNDSGATMPQGAIVVGSTANYASAGTWVAVLATTTVIGINDASLTNGSTGWMTVSGLAVCLTTGTVNIGSVIVTSDTARGYGGATATPTTGTDVGVALRTGTAAGGLTLIRMR